MIRYALACDAGHRFDSWFANSSAFDELASAGMVGCPVCGSPRVAKTVMAPAVVAKRPERQVTAVAKQPAESHDSPSVPATAGAVDVSSLSQEHREMRTLISALREKVFAATQDVGHQFPDQARRMHEGDIPHRDIRGQATMDQARSLLEDGILVMPIPALPDDWN